MLLSMCKKVCFTSTQTQDGHLIVYQSLGKWLCLNPPSAFPDLVSIYWSYGSKQNNGLPNDKENDRLLHFEDLIAAVLDNDEGCLALIRTGNGQRVWTFCVRDAFTWTTSFRLLIADKGTYPVAIKSEREIEKSAFAEVIANYPENPKKNYFA